MEPTKEKNQEIWIDAIMYGFVIFVVLVFAVLTAALSKWIFL